MNELTSFALGFYMCFYLMSPKQDSHQKSVFYFILLFNTIVLIIENNMPIKFIIELNIKYL